MLELNRHQRMENELRAHFHVLHLEMENQSRHHSGHYTGDGETHWRILLVTPDFEGFSRIERHQKVNHLLKAEFEDGLHALSLQLYSAKEWEARK